MLFVPIHKDVKHIVPTSQEYGNFALLVGYVMDCCSYQFMGLSKEIRHVFNEENLLTQDIQFASTTRD